jgi:hypothetical protein
MKANVERIIWEFLTAAGTDLYALCATRIWHSAYPESSAWSANTAGIVFFVTNATNSANGQTDDITIDFRCHGGDRTHSAAQAVARALYSRLQARGGTTTTGYIHKALRVNQQNLVDPPTGWPFTLARYNAIVE